MENKRITYDYKKIFARVSEMDYNRLQTIADKYGFKSVYEIIQSLVFCFLRVADKEHDQIETTIPQEITDMFKTLTDT